MESQNGERTILCPYYKRCLVRPRGDHEPPLAAGLSNKNNIPPEDYAFRGYHLVDRGKRMARKLINKHQAQDPISGDTRLDVAKHAANEVQSQYPNTLILQTEEFCTRINARI